MIGVTFTLIKIANASLHYLFDTREVLEEVVEEVGARSRGQEVQGESICLQDMGRGAGVGGESTPPGSCSSRQSPRSRSRRAQEAGGEEARPLPSTLRVDVHSGLVDQEASREQESSRSREQEGSRSRLPVPEEVIPVGGEGREEGDVVVLVDESPGGGGRVPRPPEQEAATPALDTVPGAAPSTGVRRPELSGRRLTSLSSLAQSSSPALDLAALLEPGVREGGRRQGRGAQVRRTKSALETGSQQVPPAPPPTSTVEEEEEVQQLPRGSDVDLASYQEQLEEATAALLRAGQYLEQESRYCLAPYSCYCYRGGRRRDEEDRGSGLYLPMVGSTSTDRETGDNSLLSTVRGLLVLLLLLPPAPSPEPPSPAGWPGLAVLRL